MNFNQMRAFHAVAVEGGFSAAAKSLGVTQPAVTVQIRGLEAELGVRLFLRRGQGAVATEAAVASDPAMAGGLVRLGLSTPATIMGLAKRFADAHPAVELRLSTGNTGQLIEDVLACRVDLIAASHIEPDPRLAGVVLGRQRLALLVPAADPLARSGDPLPLDALAGLPVLLREPSSVTRQVFLRAAEAIGLSPRMAASLGSREMIREATAAGLGYGIVFDGETGHDPRLAHRPLTAAGPAAELLAADVRLSCLPELAGIGVVAAFLALAEGV
jgi:DNA-binding transcriptional LysR family regulator